LQTVAVCAAINSVQLRRKLNGFTIKEMLMVLLVIGALTALSIPVLRHARLQAPAKAVADRP
jgi:prepilin-type N-terminal cleavage/methylation domain-containing protein